MHDIDAWMDWIAMAPGGDVAGYALLGALAASIIVSLSALRRVSASRRNISMLQEAHKSEQGEVVRLQALYADPIAREREIDRLRKDTRKHEEARDEVVQCIELVRHDYAEKRKLFDRLQVQAAIYDETIQLAEIGFYRPHFRFDDSERYKATIKELKEQQKALVKTKDAVLMSTNWEVGGSRQEGKKLVNRTLRLTLRAFNNECDAAIANVTWRNAEAMKMRIIRSYEQINKENEPLDARINSRYLDLKIEELQLTIDREEKRKQERDEAAELRRQEREERKLQEEAMRAEKEEREAEQRLIKARAQAERAVGAELEALNASIESLRQQLEEAHALTERAKSMAEQTKLGHVYVISNRGSFGEDVFKVGLTRRLDPHDRIKELGDASVPFGFDIHALVFSENAPSLEHALHAEFQDRRVNAANMRKEFFRVSVDEIEKAVSRIAPDADFYRDAEAQEYHETLMLQQKRVEAACEKETFPQAI